ncbi:MAG: anthranilate phosphoribosyltransferase [Gemmatimonadetes bacterium]|nr:anthranilate phosphoribosyltransferase [Gemmatimonadota bacterium]
MTAQEPAIARSLRALAQGDLPGEELTSAAFGELMRGETTPAQTAALLMGLRVRGETPAELTGAVRAVRSAMVRVPVDDPALVDTCGTGGGRVTTFNVSTAAALIAAGAGVPVAKHGNRSFTSRCGSADVLEALGVPVGQSPDGAARILAAAGMAFLFAPAFHPAMRFAAPVRRELAVPTLLNVVGPLANPAGVRRQVVGVADRARAPLLAESLSQLGALHAMVVHGIVGMDEISPWDATHVWEVRDGKMSTWTIEPAYYGLAVSGLDELAGGEPRENAARLERLFERPAADPVGRAAAVLNAGAALYVSGRAAGYGAGVEAAAAALDGGAAARALAKLRAAGANTSA